MKRVAPGGARNSERACELRVGAFGFHETMDIQLVRGEVTSLKVDAVVNATAWEEVHPLTPAADHEVATAIPSGNLFCKYVIQVSSPREDAADPGGELGRIVTAALSRAEDLRVRTVAFPVIHVANLTLEESAGVMVGRVEEFRHRAVMIQQGAHVFQYEHTKTKNLAVPVSDLKPLTDLFEKVRAWQTNLAENKT